MLFHRLHRLTPPTLAVAAVLICASISPSQAQSLQDAMVSAYQVNPQLQSERARQRASDEDVSRAWGGLRPSATFSGEKGRAYDDNRYPTTNLQGQATIVKVKKYRSPDVETIQLRQEVFDGLRTFSDVRHAKYAVEVGKASLTSTEQSVLGDVAQSYYDLYRDQQILKIQEDYLKSLEEERKATLARFKVKDVTQTDVALSDARVARGLADLQSYQGNVQTSRSAFTRSVGFAPADIVPAPPPLPSALPRSLEEALTAAQHNPDLRATFYASKAADTDVDIATAGLLPDLSLVASSTRTFHTDTNLSTNSGNQVLLTLTVPLYDGGVASARTRGAKHTAGQRRIDIDVQRDRVVDAVKRSWENLQATRARMRSLEENERAAEVALKGIQEEVRVGSRTILDELNTRQELLDTRIAQLRAHHDEAINAFSLMIACGRLTAGDLDLPVERYDPDAHLEESSWLPWGPWIDTDYPEPMTPPAAK